MGFECAGAELRAATATHEYGHCVQQTHEEAVALARGLPNPSGLRAEDLRAAASRDEAGTDGVLSVVRLFQWLLPGLVADVAVFEAQLAR